MELHVNDESFQRLDSEKQRVVLMDVKEIEQIRVDSLASILLEQTNRYK